MRYLKKTSIIAGTALIIGGILSPAFAQTTTQDIIKALTPEKTRSQSGSDQPKDRAFIKSVQSHADRSLSVTERQELTTIADDKATANIPIQFDYNSDAIRGDSVRLADALGRALVSPDFKGNTFIIAGHTDGKGSDATNNQLSEHRARAVKAYLVKNFSIDPVTLIPVGYGKTRLKNKEQPLSPENRRVEIINALASTANR
jgi:outer membrane protein OmpA-like peptidoglycan-associated protein